ncbi:MAG: hypothetical protein V1860_03645, partial [bacterium]
FSIVRHILKRHGFLNHLRSKFVELQLNQVPTEIRGEVESCLKSALGAKWDAVQTGNGILGKNDGPKIQGCFESAVSAYQNKMMQQATGGKLPEGMKLPEGVNREEVMKQIQEGGAPSPEMLKNIPEEYKSMIPQNIPNMAPPVSGASSGSVPPTMGISGGGESGAPVPPQMGGAVAVPSPETICKNTSWPPSCDMIPAGAGRDMCVKCKAE